MCIYIHLVSYLLYCRFFLRVHSGPKSVIYYVSTLLSYVYNYINTAAAIWVLAQNMANCVVYVVVVSSMYIYSYVVGLVSALTKEASFRPSNKHFLFLWLPLAEFFGFFFVYIHITCMVCIHYSGLFQSKVFLKWEPSMAPGIYLFCNNMYFS